jgi:HAD superfamily hydrolase (TIGR01509 family)
MDTSLGNDAPILVFDLMDTLVRDPFYTALPNYLGMSLQELLPLKHPSSWLEFELGKRTESEFLQDFYHPDSGLSLADPVGFKQVFFDYYQFLPGIERLLTQLKTCGIEMWVLSNYPIWFEAIREKLRLDRFFTGYVVSYQCALRKPNPQIYRHVEANIQNPKGKYVLIDDRFANIQGAQAAAWDGVLFTTSADLKLYLAELFPHSGLDID